MFTDVGPQGKIKGFKLLERLMKSNEGHIQFPISSLSGSLKPFILLCVFLAVIVSYHIIIPTVIVMCRAEVQLQSNQNISKQFLTQCFLFNYYDY